MSSQCANSSAMVFADMGSLAVMFSTVWSEKTTPQPNVTPRRIALEHFDLVGRIAQLHREGEIEAGRPAADAGDLHRMFPMFALTSMYSARRAGRSLDAVAMFGLWLSSRIAAACHSRAAVGQWNVCFGWKVNVAEGSCRE